MSDTQVTFTPVIVGGDEAWGKLVMSWATRKNYVSGDRTDAFQLPAGAPLSVEALKLTGQQLHDALVGSGANLDLQGIDEWVIVQDTSTRRYIRLPDAAMVEAARRQLKQGSDYNLPLFYRQDPLNCPRTIPDVNKRLTLQAQRIGDYSIGSCA